MSDLPNGGEVAPPLVNSKPADARPAGQRGSISTAQAPSTAVASSKNKVGGSDRQQELARQAKALRDERRITLDGRHEYIFASLSEAIGIDSTQVEDHVLGDEKFDCIDDFFLAGGRRVLMFTYQEPKNPEPNQPVYGRLTNVGPKKRVMISTGVETSPLSGALYYFVRPNSTKAITSSSIATDVVFGQLDASNGKMLESIDQLLANILIPLLQQYEDWGALKNRGNLNVQDFLDAMNQFTATVNGANDNIAHQVKLAPGDNDSTLNTLATPHDYQTMATNGDFVNECEKLMEKWCKQIEKILAESEQIRREADDVGPSAELTHWKQRMATFNNLLEQIKSPRCRAVVGVLQIVKSKSINRWKDLDSRITDAANEAKDNVRYLYTLDKFFSTLDRNNLNKISENIPSLMNAVRMIHSISQYYNSGERMTSLFVKITNQMINTCKRYIRNGNSRLWDIPKQELIGRMNESKKLNEEYQAYFHKTKAKLAESANERQWNFSANYIFGKFDAFCKRLDRIADVLNTIDSLSGLQNIRVEGLEPIVVKYRSVVDAIKKKSYDILDHRKPDFDNDYNEFKSQIEYIQAQLQMFIDAWFRKSYTVEQSLLFLNKFQDLEGVKIDFADKYSKLLQNYGKELDSVRKIYEKNKEDPPLSRNLPPTAGRIIWARQLYKRISIPIKLLQEKMDLNKTDEGKLVIKNFNKIAEALLQYEILFYRNWERSIDLIKKGMESSVLIRNPETKEEYVNFDPQVLELIKDAQYLAKLGLDIPEVATTLLRQEEQIRQTSVKLQELLTEIKQTYATIPKDLYPLFKPHREKVEEALRPGFVAITWSSLTIDEYIANVRQEIEQLRILINDCTNILQCRIENALQTIAETQLCEPQPDPITLDEFSKLTDESCQHAIGSITRQTVLCEKAVHFLLETLKKRLKPNEQAQIKETDTEYYECTLKSIMNTKGHVARCNDCQPCAFFNLLTVYWNKNIDAIVQCTRSSLETIRKRLQQPIRYVGEEVIREQVRNPLFRTDIVLSIPNVLVKPSLDDMQSQLNKSANAMLKIGQDIPEWFHAKKLKEIMIKEIEKQALDEGEDVKLAVQSKAPKPLHKVIAENNDVKKVVLSLNSAISTFRPDVQDMMKNFTGFSELWEKEPEPTVKAFMETKPLMVDFEALFKHYRQMETDIDEFPQTFQVGSIVFYTDQLKRGLKTEVNNWKMAYAKALNEKASQDMQMVFDKVEDIQKRLTRPCNDLDDVRTHMGALAEIRQSEILIDQTITPVEETYAMLNKYEIAFNDGKPELVDTLQYAWKKCLQQGKEVQSNLLEIQPKFKQNLSDNVSTFQADVNNFSDEYTKKGPMVRGIPPREASDRLTLFQAKFDELWRKFETYSAGEELFGLAVTDYPDLQKIKRELSLLQKLYGLYNIVIDTINGYYDIAWVDVDIEKINNDLLDFQNRCRKLPKGLKEYEAFDELKKTIDDFNETCPLLEMMANKSMKPRHWERIATLTGHKFDIESDNFLLRDIMAAPLLKYKEDIEDICISATKEKDIEAKLNQVVADWGNQNFQFSPFKSRGELLLKGDSTGEVIALMEDSLMVLGSLMSNRYNAPFKKKIQEWVQKLTSTTEIIEKWMAVQNLWIYLEAVFVGGDIAKQLPAEAKRFGNIDKSWQKIMQRAHENLNVVSCCTADDTLAQLLPHLFEQLELCQKSLTGYLEKKRLVFPRFFFVSDPALLEILGQASDSHTIQNHLLSVFDNTKTVTFDEKVYDKILTLNSQEGEQVPLKEPVMAQGNVEVWLGDLLKASRSSLHKIIRDGAIAIQDSAFNLMDFLNSFPAQVGLLGLQMLWTRDSEIALNNTKTDKKIMQDTAKKFLDILNALINKTTEDLSKLDRVKIETLITIHVHQKDIFDELVFNKTRSIGEFDWLKQCRFYFDEDADICRISITDVDFKYMNEYLGCTDRLVITPLTDRCYITLSQALHMALGGAPAGPAGTGKTETTKDMGRCLGKFVVVFNCSDQMDYRGLGRIYKGLAQSGSWGCFDEFNRIELPVLSVAAQQIDIVLRCKKEKKSQFIFTDGDNVDMDTEFGIFLTMNPGYAGRQELPENLKINFRTVAMMVPDRAIIMRVKLASCGFLQNVKLSKKFYTLYKLCEEQLTKQVHYDFGLRNILSVLRTLGAFKRENPTDSEEKTMMRVLRDMNLSKLIDEDEPLFLSLIDDLFPGIQLEIKGYPEIEAAIKTQTELAQLVHHPPWVLKLIQLYETQRVRHGMMTLGPSGAGKTKCINILMKAMTECGAPHREMRMNPKAITAPQMFGRLDVATNDWTDGIFSTLWRRTLKTKKGDHVWLILDGPVDAIWIENLNSVLDDNKTLTLANGDRIPMAPNCKIIFEVHNIDNASPATVSRNGMVFMSASVMNWEPIVKGWLLKRSASESDVLLDLYAKSFPAALTYTLQSLDPKMPLLESMYARQSLDLLEGLIHKDKAPSPDVLGRLYVFALMWSVGALLELFDRKKLEEHLVEKKNLDLPPIKGEETIFEYVVNPETGQWQHWSNRVPEYIYPKDSIPEYSSILVPNVDNVRTDFLIDTIAKQEKSVLLIGEQGTAKTVMVKGFCSKYDPEVQSFKSVNFSSATTATMVQRTIESYVDKRVGTTYGPPGGKKMTIFIDDINMPIINEWGDQVTNEITRQLMEQNGFYNLEKPGEFTSIVDIQFIAAMIQPGGGRNDIPQRLKRQFCIFNCTLPSNASIDKVFSTVGLGYFCKERGFNQDVINMIEKLVPATRKLWQKTKVKMLPTPARFHYVFNLRDLSRIWQGMLNIISSVTGTKLDVIMSLWKHECYRVIADRFVAPEDKDWFEKTIKIVAEEDCGSHAASAMHAEPYFVDFLREAPEPTGEEGDDADFEAPKIYEPIPSYEFLSEKLLMFQQQYNETIKGSKMDLVFFKDAMTHLVKISRIIRTPRGCALLVGVGGSGKQSLTRLASFIAGYQTFQITLTRSYNVTNLMEDLKLLYRTAGQKGKGVTFLFTDNEIKDEAFLEYMNNVLASGEVSNLFARDEIDEILGELTAVMKREFPRRPPTNENLYDYFLTRVRNNLHVVLCFSPVGEKFRSRSLKFPALISGCTMDWFQRWPKDALVAVSKHFIINYDIACTPPVKQELIMMMGEIQDQVAEACVDYFNRFRRQTHVTPKSYLSFLSGYKSIYTEKRKEIGKMADRMNTGLKKLISAAEEVRELAKELEGKEKELVVANEKADLVMQDVNVKKAAATKVAEQVQRVADSCKELVDQISADKAIAEAKLEVARPALEEAEAALRTIKQADIATVKKLGRPPHLIMRIMDCALVLFQRPMELISMDPERPCPKPSWSESLKLMGGSDFLNTLMNFPKDTINAETVELLQPYLLMEDFNLENAKRVSGNVAGLCSWAIAMAYFYSINREVLPLKANLAVQESRLAQATAGYNNAQAQLAAKMAEVAVVQAEFDKANAIKQALLADAEACRRKMHNASALIDGLSGERVRWTEASKGFEAQTGRLVGDVLLATGFLSYTGPFNQEFRTLLIKQWRTDMNRRKIPYSEDLNIVSFLVDNATISEWNLQGLPNDELSIQNGLIVTSAARFPLLIDPQGQGKAWIRNKESTNELQITTLNHKYFRTHLEDSLSLGRPLMIEDVGDDLDPALDNVLEKNFLKSGSTLKVKVGDKECDIMQGFKLYITTKLANPSYTPEVYAKTSVIDFTVTMKGLEDQLLGIVIQKEKAELEAERVRLLEEVTSNKRRTKELEDNLLYRLTSTEGSLVEDESLIQVLVDTKATSKEVNEKLTIAAETEIKINAAREEFRPVATRGSIVYFLIVEMSMVNVMYQISLKQFLGLFEIGRDKAQPSPITVKRIQNIIESLTYEVWKYSSRGLYERDKVLYTLLLALKIDMQKGNVKPSEFQVLIKGGAALDMNAVEPRPDKMKKWLTDMTWLNLVELSKLAHFSQVLRQVVSNDKTWYNWYLTDAPEEVTFPEAYSTSLDTFKKLLLVRSFAPDRTLPMAKKYIGESLGIPYAEGYILNLEAMWQESDKRTPLVCFLSMGSDPTDNVLSLAKKQNTICGTISMGQGQEVHARRLLQQSQQEGRWILLQNCHLGLGFLEEMLDTVITTEQVHENFRCWVTTEPHPQFSINVLQSSIKFTFEPPQGVKAGLKRTFAGLTQEVVDASNFLEWKIMLYTVAFLHTTVQERRKFGPLGWNIPYEFNQSDFSATVQFIQNHMDDMGSKWNVSWPTVRYMIGEVHYGGRVTDDFDKRLLNTYTRVWFLDNMFTDKFEFAPNYKIPRCKTIQEFRAHVETMSLFDSPNVFGLHPNADITYQKNTADSILATIVNIQPKDAGAGGGETREAVVYRQCDDMLSKLPEDYVPHEVRGALQKQGALQPLNIFLKQEVDRMQRVITVVRNTLKDLKLAIDGTIIMNENLKDALDNIFDARVPATWRKVSWDSATLGFWFSDLLDRNLQFFTWLFSGRPNVFWLTGFFNPQGFLTAMRQEITRNHKGWSLDNVVLANDVMKMATKEEVTSPPSEGVYIYGLKVDGAAWRMSREKGGHLADPPPKQLYSDLPVVHVYATNEPKALGNAYYVCPVYKKPRRTDLTFIFSLSLKINNNNPDFWCLRGVALLCDTK
ncbi:unnamed protein product [Adineta steineri]|uniref:AAA+ ATPase domain-containing protein n=1 Tax=Adineta steineri TaxID=433720 RepID=A0A814CWI1_9BILA|nr:unnamed protein product [Adineta steineri]CAF3502211.1 unnamed protein product [Adineta steineri]